MTNGPAAKHAGQLKRKDNRMSCNDNVQYPVGSRVKVTVEGTVTSCTPSATTGTPALVITRDNGRLHSFLLDNETVEVTAVAPKDWPPQAGDLWATPDGREWFVRVTSTFPAGLFITGDGLGNGIRNIMAYIMKDRNPTLIRRRGR
jgi:hypothetical protein